MRYLATLAVILALILSPVMALAQVPNTYEQVTVADSSIGITAAIYQPTGGQPASYCLLILQSNEVRWRVDGLAPTTTVGNPMAVGSELELRRLVDMQLFRAIRTGASSGVLNVTCQF